MGSQDVDLLSALTQLLQFQEVGLLDHFQPSMIQSGRPQPSFQILSIKFKELESMIQPHFHHIKKEIIKQPSSTKPNKLKDQRVTSIPTGTGITNPRTPHGTQRAEVVLTTPVTCPPRPDTDGIQLK